MKDTGKSAVFSRLMTGMTFVLSAGRFAAAEFETPMAVTGVRIVTGADATIESGVILIEKGRIVAVGKDVDIPAHAERFDATGMTAYPGFIDAMVHLGIPNVQRTPEERLRTEDRNPDEREGALPAMHGANRRGIRPQVRALERFSPEAKALEAHRSAGFTSALVTPQSGILAGTSDLVNLSDDPIRRIVLASDVGMHASFEPGEPGEYPRTIMGIMALFRQVMLDAIWYAKAQKFAQRRLESPRPPLDPALEALQPVLARSRPVIFEANSEREIHRALDLAKEFNLAVAISGGKEAYKVVDRLKSERVPVIATLKFDEEPEYGKKDKSGAGSRSRKEEKPQPEVSESESSEGEEPSTVSTRKGDKEEEKIYEPLKVRQERRRLWEEQVANVLRLREAGIPVALRTRDFNKPDELFAAIRTLFDRGLTEEAAVALLSTKAAEIIGMERHLGAIAPGRVANVTLTSAPLKEKDSKCMLVLIDGRKFRIDRGDEKKGEAGKDKKEEKPAGAEAADATELPDRGPTFESEIRADRFPTTRTGGTVLLTGATILPITAPPIENGSILVREGKIAAIGKNLAVPEGVTVIDVTGRYILPGFVDPHSHLGIDSVNESAFAISAEVRIADVVNPESVGLYRALAGGTTTHHLMHGSANPIGGQCVVTKLKYTRPVSEMILADAPRTIKFALGENVKQSNFPTAWDKRFPNTRMGVEAAIRAAFSRAGQYRSEWDEYRRRSRSGEDVLMPRTDLRLEALADVLAGGMVVHCHCYRSEEILRLFAVAEEYGVRIGTLHHVLEGYRIAPEIARHGSGASTFSNFWAYKVEAYGAIPHNAALMTEFGVHSSLNSDSPDTIRYLGQEAAKCVRWGGMEETAALKLVTLNPAEQLGVAHRVGSLEVGKDGDIAVFNGHPLNSFSRCVMTLIEGEVYFEDGRAAELPTIAPGTSLAMPKVAATVNPATIHPMREDPSEIIENGTVVVLEDMVYAVGTEVEIPPGAGIIEARGLHVYPGLIDAGGTLGLTEVGAVRATEDQREIGTFNPHLLALTAIHPHSEHIRVSRAAGITTAVVRPGGSRISGQGTVIRLDGWTAAEMALVDSMALHVSVPSLPVHVTGQSRRRPVDHDHSHCEDDEHDAIEAQGAGDPVEEAKKRQKDEHRKNLRELEEYWDRAVHYARVKELAQGDSSLVFTEDLSLEAMIPYVRGQKPVVMVASTYKEILDTLEFAEKRKVRLILSGGSESWKLADELARKNIPVILSSPTTMPAGEFEPWDSVYRCAGILDRAGVRFCFGTDRAADAYNLGIEVAMAVAHGLPQAKAEYALTRGAAEILGLADRTGSVEPGKQADLIVTTDSPLQATSRVTHMFIDGRPVDLSNIHTESYEKFRSRPRPRLPALPALRGPAPLNAR
jgi:imidazolonepropionase-like amidohydrolase